MKFPFLLLGITGTLFLFCREKNPLVQTGVAGRGIKNEQPAPLHNTFFDTANKTIHVFVALCDNKYQGIIPVPAGIGNGQDPNSNLYWGCDAGIRTWFKKSHEWVLISRYKIDSIKMERLIFKHARQKFYLVADAYNGKYIKDCTVDFLKSCSGQVKHTLQVNHTSIGIYGNARLLSYIGHDGLMDFRLTNNFQNTDGV